MEWQDEGLVLGTRKHGETSAILEVMTRNHGRHFGLVRGGRSSRMRPLLQVGNSVSLTWRARLDEHLGTWEVEPVALRAASLMSQPGSVYGIQVLAAHARLLPERDPHPGLYDAAMVIVEHLGEIGVAAPLMVHFEINLLEELGFGLELQTCAATGQTEELEWVSPKTGRAVSKQAGEPWAGKLFALPGFLQPGNSSGSVGAGGISAADIEKGFNLSGYFLDRHIYGPRGINAPPDRAGFIRSFQKTVADSNQ